MTTEQQIQKLSDDTSRKFGSIYKKLEDISGMKKEVEHLVDFKKKFDDPNNNTPTNACTASFKYIGEANKEMMEAMKDYFNSALKVISDSNQLRFSAIEKQQASMLKRLDAADEKDNLSVSGIIIEVLKWVVALGAGYLVSKLGL